MGFFRLLHPLKTHRMDKYFFCTKADYSFRIYLAVTRFSFFCALVIPF